MKAFIFIVASYTVVCLSVVIPLRRRRRRRRRHTWQLIPFKLVPFCPSVCLLCLFL